MNTVEVDEIPPPVNTSIIKNVLWLMFQKSFVWIFIAATITFQFILA